MKRNIRRITNETHKEIRRYFQATLNRHGNGPAAVGWFSEETQRQRFRSVCSVGDLNNCTILDVGCGLGHLYPYLRERFHEFEYTGIDILEDMVISAQRRFPEAKFVHADIFAFKPERKFDYILAVGVYNLEVEDNDTTMQHMITHMFDLCQKGVAASMTCEYPTYGGKQHGFDPVSILKFCMNLAPWVRLRKDYLPNDFTVFLYREVQKGKQI